MEQDKETFFVQVKEHVNIKRDILESQKVVVEALKNYEKIKLLRTKKVQKIQKLRKLLRESSKLFSNLKSALPYDTIKDKIEKKKLPVPVIKKKPEVKIEKVPKVEKKPKPKPVVKKPLTELDKLEMELNSIEKKLNSLQ